MRQFGRALLGRVGLFVPSPHTVNGIMGYYLISFIFIGFDECFAIHGNPLRKTQCFSKKRII